MAKVTLEQAKSVRNRGHYLSKFLHNQTGIVAVMAYKDLFFLFTKIKLSIIASSASISVKIKMSKHHAKMHQLSSQSTSSVCIITFDNIGILIIALP